ncbi:cation:proton antiporter [Weissella koreensis]|uniref:cation:proton antiporter n=1 Tax=Weissella koreensis TaxID=165096 RepID=UPI0022BA1517|nr:cation:proton antiporter [Weissella koreensis]MCZ9311094.1 cation:proton antiporter [Weissella koreensis]
MNLISIIVIILASITISNFISKLFPQIANTYLNTIFGFGIGLLPWVRNIFPQLNNEVFMLVILAPLLFFDGQRTPIIKIETRLKEIVGRSAVLVLISALIVTFSTHVLLGLNVAFALIIAAISTPTDATGFETIITSRKVDSGVSDRISEEALFNDASGIILLQAGFLWFATGTISFSHNFVQFLFMTIGGAIIGIILSNLVIIIRQLLMRSTFNVNSSQTLLYILTPILLYFIAESLHTSGIIAVVIAGLTHNSESNRSRFVSSRQTVFTLQSISFLTEVLNSVVFFILGISLAKIIAVPIPALVPVFFWIGTGILVYFLLILCRFIYSKFKYSVRESIVFSFGGVHGTVTLAMTFIASDYLPNNLFIGLIITETTIILLSFLVPTILFKIILPQSPDPNTREQHLQKIREQAVSIGIKTIENLKVDSEIKEMVLYDLRDQSKRNSIGSFLKQYRQFGTNGTHLNHLKSRNRQQLMIQAFTAERNYLYQLANQIPEQTDLIHEIYSEILYAEILMLDSQNRLV